MTATDRAAAIAEAKRLLLNKGQKHTLCGLRQNTGRGNRLVVGKG